MTQLLRTTVLHHHHHHHNYHHLLPALLTVRSATRSQQPPERAILNHTDCFSHCEIMGLKDTQDCLHPCDPRASQWSLPIFWRECSQDLLSISTVINRAMCPNRERCRAWIVEVRRGLLHFSCTETNWYHLMPNISVGTAGRRPQVCIHPLW